MLGSSDSKCGYNPEYTDDEMQRWICCPHCGSQDAELIVWGECYDMDFDCPNCDNHYGVR